MSLTPNHHRDDQEPSADTVSFGDVARVMMRLTLRNGIGFPAVEYTSDELAMFAAYSEGGLTDKYNTTPYAAEYAEQQGVANDSKAARGLLAEPIDDMQHMSLYLLGEGPGIQYGEVGRISLSDDRGLRFRTYALNNDGTIDISSGLFNEAEDIVSWKEPHTASPQEITELATALAGWHPAP